MNLAVLIPMPHKLSAFLCRERKPSHVWLQFPRVVHQWLQLLILIFNIFTRLLLLLFCLRHLAVARTFAIVGEARLEHKLAISFPAFADTAANKCFVGGPPNLISPRRHNNTTAVLLDQITHFQVLQSLMGMILAPPKPTFSHLLRQSRFPC
ncbi:hypothetical protein VTK56DRAFT_1481 [Thermocarpiscus australiensis]